MKARLYLCPTPIGNLEDITLRVLRILKEVDCIAAENTRHTKKLLAHFGIRKPLFSYYDTGRAETKERKLIEKLKSGDSMALVSSAGTPVLCDPGYKLVRQCFSENIPVVSLPGPSALIAALAVSGLPPHPFFFGGFLPVKKQARRNFLKSVADFSCTLIFYETPHRIAETLSDCLEILGNREISLVRELTKIHEEILRGNLLEILQLTEKKNWKGEITLLLGGREKHRESWEHIQKEIQTLLDKRIPISEISRQIAKQYGIPKKQVYNFLHHSSS